MIFEIFFLEACDEGYFACDLEQSTRVPDVGERMTSLVARALTSPIDRYRETVCLHEDQRCDGVVSCATKSDERNCRTSLHRNPPVLSTHLQRMIFICFSAADCTEEFGRFECASDGLCIRSLFRCDGHNDCDDASDEFDCPSQPGQSLNFIT